jgi:hypothetical protein
MKFRFIHAWPATLGLALTFGLAACDNRDVAVTPANEESALTGMVAFRLSDTALQVVLSADTMAMIREILERSSSRHPGQFPAITSNCLQDKPVVKRQIIYNGNLASSMTWDPSSYCDELPESWKALDPVDAILDALFAKQ